MEKKNYKYYVAGKTVSLQQHELTLGDYLELVPVLAEFDIKSLKDLQGDVTKLFKLLANKSKICDVIRIATGAELTDKMILAMPGKVMWQFISDFFLINPELKSNLQTFADAMISKLMILGMAETMEKSAPDSKNSSTSSAADSPANGKPPCA